MRVHRCGHRVQCVGDGVTTAGRSGDEMGHGGRGKRWCRRGDSSGMVGGGGAHRNDGSMTRWWGRSVAAAFP
jgi:hypothetical protein